METKTTNENHIQQRDAETPTNISLGGKFVSSEELLRYSPSCYQNQVIFFLIAGYNKIGHSVISAI